MIIISSSDFFGIFAFDMTLKEKFCAFWATGFGVGYWPWGPGTMGALLAVFMWLACSCYVSAAALMWITVFAILFSTIVGSWCTDQLRGVWGDDPSKVVIDEMIGVWIPLAVCPVDWRYATAAFVLFRFFDILKPLGIRSLDNRHGGFWVMADDILAGIYSLVIILAIQWACQ